MHFPSGNLLQRLEGGVQSSASPELFGQSRSQSVGVSLHSFALLLGSGIRLTFASESIDKAYLWFLQENNRAIRFYERQSFVFSGDTLEVAIGGQKVTELRYIRKL